MEPVIHSLQGTLAFQSLLPKDWKGPILSGSDPWYYNGQLGTIVLQEFHHEDFSIFFSTCFFLKKAKLSWIEKADVRIQYILDGQLVYNASENKTVKLNSGLMNAVWAPERKTIGEFSKGKFNSFHISVHPKIVQELLPSFPNGKDFPAENLKRRFSQFENTDIYETLNNFYTGEARIFFYKTKIREHLLWFLHPKQTEIEYYSDDVKERIYRVDRKIMENLNKHYTTYELSRYAKMPEAKLIEAFKNIIGMSMFDRYKEGKLGKAKKYLLETDVQVKVLYEMVGYESYTGFVEAFTKRFGISPLQYRKKYRPFD